MVEGNSGTTNLIFELTLSKPTSETVMVDYATRDASAVAGTDYSAAFGVAIFPPGITKQEILVSVNGDILSEADETFWLMLTNAVNATLVRDHAIGTILDDDSPPALSINDVALVEDYSETTNAIFNVSLSTVSGQTITVDYVTANGTAIAGPHFVPVSDVLTFVPGTTRRTLAVPVTGSINATAATFSVNLLNPVNATIARNRATATIMIDERLRVLLANLHSNETSVGKPKSRAKSLLEESQKMESAGVKTASSLQALPPALKALGVEEERKRISPPHFNAPKPSLDIARPLAALPAEEPSSRPAVRPATETPPQRITSGSQPVLKTTRSAVANNLIEVIPRQGADLSLGLFASAKFVHVEQSVAYSIVVTNNGPELASAVFVTNWLPASATFLSAQASQGTYVHAHDLVIFNLGTLSNSSSASATIAVKFSAAGSATNVAQVTAAEIGTIPSNKSTSAVVLAINDLPKISRIPGQVTRENMPTTPIPFVVIDTETPANDLIILGTSSNTNLVPDENFIFDGTSSNRSLILVPEPNRVGTTEISLTALDSEGGEASSDFTLTVLPTFSATLRIEPTGGRSPPPPRIERIERVGDLLNLYFSAEPGQTYAVECCDSMSFNASWQPLTNMSASSTSTLVEFSDPIAGRSRRFYRLSVLGAVQPSAPPSQVKLSFDAIPGQVYTIEYCDSLGAGSWNALTNIGPVSTQATITVSDSTLSQPQRFYRLRSP